MRTTWDRLFFISIILGIVCGFSIFLLPSKNIFEEGILNSGSNFLGGVLIFITFLCACYAILYKVRAEQGNKFNGKTILYTVIAIPTLFLIVWWINS